ncbi:integration host factor subunit beta [Wolbachia pipientis]|uniref:Integration host factor subunit beta n=1 Tax=Wolbachia pipientis TaxID=955 RepID=A0A1E7QK95_WOLPI|nr:HU family DNA-binding protein [Wolbachia pipientis]OEY86776.1 integration host factor subunit beta [Wolbachia pipientis]
MATKSDITARVLEKHSVLDKKIVALVINIFFEILSDALKEHNRIEFRRFGSFSVRSYNVMKINDKLVKNRYFKIYFRSSRNLISEVNSCKQ